MADLDEQIRELIARRPSHFPGLSRPGETYDRYKGWSDRSAAALLAVLELHAADEVGFCRECSDEFPAPYLCPTKLAIAKELGIEVADA